MPEIEKPLNFDDENIAEFLVYLGFVRLTGEKWGHKDFGFPFDFAGKKKSGLVLRLWGIFGVKGYENCQRDFRSLIGVKDQRD